MEERSLPGSSGNQLIQNSSMPHIVMHNSQTSTAPSVQVHSGITAHHNHQATGGSSTHHPSIQPSPRVFETFGVDTPNPRNRNYPGLLQAIIRHHGQFPLNHDSMRRLSEVYGFDWPWSDRFDRQLRVDVVKHNNALRATLNRAPQHATNAPVQTITQHQLSHPTPPSNRPPIRSAPGHPPSTSVGGVLPLTNQSLPPPQTPIGSVSSAVPFVVTQPLPFGLLAQQMQQHANGVPQRWIGVPLPLGFHPQNHFGRPIPPQPTTSNVMRPPLSQSVKPVIQHNISRPLPPQSVQNVIQPGMIRSHSIQRVILTPPPAPLHSTQSVHPNLMKPVPLQPVAHQGLMRSQSVQPIVIQKVMRAPAPQMFPPSTYPSQPARSQSVQQVVQSAPSSSVYQPAPLQVTLHLDEISSKKILDDILDRIEKMVSDLY